MNSKQFDWLDFYEEFAKILLKYKHDREKLVTIIKRLYSDWEKDGIIGAKIESDDKLVDIDPFSIYTFFNKGIKIQNKKRILTDLKNSFNVKADIPTSFAGIPHAMNFKSLFYQFKNDRGENDINIMWELFSDLMNYKKNNSKTNIDRLLKSIDKTVALKEIDWSKLTAGLFWIASDNLITWNPPNIKFIYESGVFNPIITKLPSDRKIKNATNYYEVVEELSNFINSKQCNINSFRELSYEAYLYGKKEKNNMSKKNTIKENKGMRRISKNLILFGPPGTGKTYNTVNYAVAICENRNLKEVENEDYSKVKERYDKLYEEGRIEFITFHQSYGYEEFIEGIKPNINNELDIINYEVKEGIFLDFCDKAYEYSVQVGDSEYKNPAIWSMELNGRRSADENEIKKYCFDNDCIRLGFDNVNDEFERKPRVYEKTVVWNFKNEMKKGDLVLIPKNKDEVDAIGVVMGDYEIIENQDSFKRKRDVEWIVKDNTINIKNINKDTGIDRKTLYELWRVDLQDLLVKLQSSSYVVKTQRKEPCVFIIDEINRGNISKIFGELITLIEETKRKGEKEETHTKLPYSKKEFSVPSNVYILGTMNTADRSIALIDTALRRRFSFEEMMPNYSALQNVEVEGIEIVPMLKAMNDRIEILYDREHTIGHAFFMQLLDNNGFDLLKDIFKYKIIPLLQEYFYEDYEKIQYVLGDNEKEYDNKFIIDQLPNTDLFKGNIGDYDMPEKVYMINETAFNNPDSYKEIY